MHCVTLVFVIENLELMLCRTSVHFWWMLRDFSTYCFTLPCVGWMFKLVTSLVMNRAFQGPKKREKPAKKLERPEEDIESRYEERAERNAAKLDENVETMAVDEEVDALPVKLFTGELRYLPRPKKASGRNHVL